MNLTQTVTDPMPTKRCAAAHIAPWLIETGWFTKAVCAVKDGVWMPQAVTNDPEERVAFQLDGRGVAVISINGFIMKIDSKFGGTNSIRVRAAIRAAIADNDVEAIFIVIDSPGGTSAGTEELAREVILANQKKPVFVHGDDLIASAAMWAAAGATRITANQTAMVGCIGTVLVIEDTSKAAEMEGIKVHLIKTGEFKGAGTDGTPITGAQLAVWQELIDDLNTPFLAAIAKGRRLPIDAVRKLADGRVHIAAKAKALGLIDAVEFQDDAFAFAVRTVESNRKARRATSDRVAALAADVAGGAKLKLAVGPEGGFMDLVKTSDSALAASTLAQIPWREAVAVSGKDSDLEAVAKLRGVEIAHNKTLGSETPKPEVGPDGGFIVPPEIADAMANLGRVPGHAASAAWIKSKAKVPKPKGEVILRISGDFLHKLLLLPDKVEILDAWKEDEMSSTVNWVGLLLKSEDFPPHNVLAGPCPEVEATYRRGPNGPEFVEFRPVDTAESERQNEKPVNTGAERRSEATYPIKDDTHQLKVGQKIENPEGMIGGLIPEIAKDTHRNLGPGVEHT